jgi:hypothetical protein
MTGPRVKTKHGFPRTMEYQFANAFVEYLTEARELSLDALCFSAIDDDRRKDFLVRAAGFFDRSEAIIRKHTGNSYVLPRNIK